jgi:hypothetical protein
VEFLAIFYDFFTIFKGLRRNPDKKLASDWSLLPIRTPNGKFWQISSGHHLSESGIFGGNIYANKPGS